MANETYVLFELAGTTYALPSREVQHIEMLDHVTPVPNANPAVEGVIFSRGQVIPAMNLRMRFGFPREPHTLRTRVIVVDIHQRTVALIVDAAREFRAIPDNAIRSIDETLAGVDRNYLRGVATLNDRLILLLNLAAVLNHGGAGRMIDTARGLAAVPSSSTEAVHANP
ncbi:MAG TPA: chemotaxis protein CheW [Verrucomicrobiae bacterium]|nr:chemotaxis protein CheW [Verrucomicrobiae bacterium]